MTTGSRAARIVLAALTAALTGVTVAQAAPTGGTTVDAVRPASAVSAADDVAGAMHVLPARRVLDTRSGLGAAKGARASGSTTSVTVLGAGGVPASGVGAVAVHVTVTGATGSGYVSAFPGGGTAPTASTLNVTAGQNTTNLAVVPLGADGTISLRFMGTGTVQLLADVAGWSTAGTPTEPGTTVTLAPARLMDTRSGLGGRTGALPSGSLAHLQVSGRGDVPASVGSVTLNVTVVTPAKGGWLAVTPTDPGAGRATTSSVNFVAGQSTANAVTTALSPTGTIDLRLSVGTTAHVVVDVLAWTVPGTPTVSGALTAQAPTRLLDTRTVSDGAPVEAGGTTVVDVMAPSGSAAGAAVLNVTAVGATRPGFVVVSADGLGTPNASQLSVPVSAGRAALVMVPTGAFGRVRLTVSSASPVQLVVDRVATIAQPASTVPLLPTPSVTAEPSGAGVHVSWHPVDGATGYVVRRMPDAAPASVFQGAPVGSVGSATTDLVDTGAPGVTYTYAVFASESHGDVSEAGLGTARTAPIAWTGGVRANPYYGSPQDVSCPTTSWCLAVGSFGQSWVWSGGVWSASGSVDGDANGNGNGFRSVSCPTTSFCLASLYGHRIATWHGGVWTVTATAWDHTDVSCWSTTACGLAVDGSNAAKHEIERWTSGSIGEAVDVAGRDGAIALSCPTSTCHFLTLANGAVYVHRAGTGATTTKWVHYGFSGELSCISDTWCMAVVEAKFRTGYGSSWSAAGAAADPHNSHPDVTMDLSCASRASCTLVGGGVGSGTQGGDALRWNGSTWSLRIIGAGTNTDRAVDCASASSCMVVDERGRFNRWTGSSWTSRTTFASTRGGFASLDCPSATSCLATDSWGNVLDWSGGTSWPRKALSENGVAADCAGSTCMVLEGETWRVRRSGTWGASTRSASSPYGQPVCASASRCFSLAGSTYWQWNGTDWSAARSLPADVGFGVGADCPTSTFCLAVGPGGKAVAWNGSTWVSRPRAPLPANVDVDLDCVSPSFCVALADGTSAVYTPAGWRQLPRSVYGISGLACRSTTLCFSLSGGALVAFDGTAWALTSMAFGPDVLSGHLSCAGTSRCVVAGGEHIWWTP